MSEAQLTFPGVIGVQTSSESEWTWTDEEGPHLSAEFHHVTVLREETVSVLRPRDGGVYIDATLGGGGHTEALFAMAPNATVIAIDRDPAALAAAAERLQPFADRITYIHSAFSDVREELTRIGIDRVDGILADLGVSSPQLDSPERGMSFRLEGPLDMRMDPTSGETVKELVHRLSDSELADVIFHYGDERRSRRIARSIKRALFDNHLETTIDLRRAVIRAVGPVRVGGVDPATRTFQALRIAVNRELDELAALLKVLPDLLVSGGIAAIISFHSLEDRKVKEAFRKEGVTSVWKKPVTASDAECELNPRARSAKLRAGIFGSDDEEEEEEIEEAEDA